MPKKYELNKEMLPVQQLKDYELREEGENIDYSKFETNNWMRIGVENETLLEIYEKGGALWQDFDGSTVYRPHVEEDIIKFESDRKAAQAIANFLDRKKVKLWQGSGSGENFQPPDVYVNEVLSVKERFTVFCNSEFYRHNNLWYRTAFRPTKYMKITKNEYKYPETILKLIQNLCNDNVAYYDWVINWLAGYFQTLRKSQVSLLMRGDQGSGKGVFFNKILAPLFGEQYCAIVDSDRLDSQFKGWVAETLFFNLNEIAVDMKARKSIKNFLKQLVTDDKVQIETKHKDAKEVRIYGNILITSNEPFPIEIEASDRRFTVIRTGKTFAENGWNYRHIIEDINAELEDFAVFLKKTKVDWKMYHTALETPEKAAIVDATNSQTVMFIRAILKKDILFFEDLKDDSYITYNDLKNGFKNNRVLQTVLIKAYEDVFESNKSAKRIMADIRKLEPNYFGKHKIKRHENIKYFELDSKDEFIDMEIVKEKEAREIK